MRDSGTTKNSFVKRFCLSVLLLLVILSLGFWGLVSLHFARARPNLTALKPYVGTWRGKHEDPVAGFSIWDLRADGTARWRLSSGESLGSTGKTIGYSEWAIEDGQLLIYQFSSPNAATRARLLSPIFGLRPTERFELVDTSENQFSYRGSYRDPKTGKKTTVLHTFLATEDEVVRSAR